MEPFFLVLHVLIASALIGVVLIQRSSTDGFGLGSGSGSNFMSGRQAASFLTRVTAILATLFILNSLWLGWLATHSGRMSLADQVEAAAGTKNAGQEADAAAKDGTAPPAVPTEEGAATAPAKDKAEEVKPEDSSKKEGGDNPAVPLAE